MEWHHLINQSESSETPVVNWLTDQSETWMLLHCPTLSSARFFCTLSPNKDRSASAHLSVCVCVFFSPLLDLCKCFSTLLIIRSLLSPNGSTLLQRDKHELVHVWMCMGVAHCAAVKNRDVEKKRWEWWPQWRVGGLSLFVHKNGACVGPGPPSLILYQLTPTPHPHTWTQQRRKLTRSWCFFPFFSSFCSLCCHKIYCILSVEHFLNYRLEVP